jgi:dipeptidase
MHPGSSQTVASMVAHLRPDGLTAWCSLVTPCISPFLPFYVDVDVPEIYARGTNEPDADSPWWRFRSLLDAVCLDWPARYPVVRREWDRLEEDLLHAAVGYDRAPQHVRASRVQANVREMLRRLAKLERELGVQSASPRG